MQQEETMSGELQDFRGKLTAETDCVLAAESRLTGDDKQSIVREVMHAWAIRKIEMAKITHDMLLAKGLPGIGEGTSGKRR